MSKLDLKVEKKTPKIRKRFQDYQTCVLIVCYPIMLADSQIMYQQYVISYLGGTKFHFSKSGLALNCTHPFIIYLGTNTKVVSLLYACKILYHFKHFPQGEKACRHSLKVLDRDLWPHTGEVEIFARLIFASKVNAEIKTSKNSLLWQSCVIVGADAAKLNSRQNL